MLPNVPGERDTIILALHVSIITSNDGKHTGELMDNVANGVCLCICQPQYQHLPQVPPQVAPRAVGGRHELLVDAVAVELQRDAGLGHPLHVPSEVPRVARAAAQLQAEAGQRGPRLSLSCGSSSSGSEAALIVRHITRVANKCCINKYLVTCLTMSSHSDEAPLSVGVHGEHQGQLHAGVRPGCRGTS